MGAREMTSKESAAARRRTIFLLIVYVHVVTSQHSGDEAPTPPCPPSPPQLPYSSLNSCPDNLITQILDPAISCTPPPHEGGDLSPVTCMRSHEEPIRSATFAELVVKSLSSSRKDEGKQWEIIFELIYPAAVCVLFFCEIPLRIIICALNFVCERGHGYSSTGGVVVGARRFLCFSSSHSHHCVLAALIEGLVLFVNLHTSVGEACSAPNASAHDEAKEEELIKLNRSCSTHEPSQPKCVSWNALVACSA